MIRLWSEPPNNTNHFDRMYAACEDWAGRYAETLTTQRLSLTHITDNEPAYTVGHWRFDWAEDATALLDDLEADLQAEVAWYRLRFHECSHDESDSVECSWDETREFGTIPAGIP